MAWWVAVAAASEVTIGLGRYHALAPPAPREAAPAPFVERRDVTVTARGDELVIDATFRVAVPAPGPVALLVAGPSLRVERFTVDGRDTALGGGADGPVFAGVVSRPVTLRLVGSISPDEGAAVALLGAGAGEIALPADLALVDGLPVGEGRWVPRAPDPALDLLSFAPAPPAERDRGLVVHGSVGYGITALDGELRRAARLRWRIGSGSLREVSFTVPGAGPDLTVEGPQVGEVARVGDRVTVTLAGEERSIVDLVVRTSSALETRELTTVDLGLPALEGVFRSEATVVLARDVELDVVPRLQGLQARSALRLPPIVDGLVEGTPSAAFAGASGAGSIDVLRYAPAEGPATLCDVATYTVALTEDGRSLVRAHFSVRNDRGHLLRIQPPAGHAPIAALVANRPVPVSRDGDAWLVPLDKSVESVAGLLSFPVEVAFLGVAPAAEGARLRRDLPLPAIDVPTAVVRATVHLPPGFADRTVAGRGDRVDAFSVGEGITYGFAVGDVRAAEAESLWQSALTSFTDNEFDAAQRALDAIRALGGESDNTVALQGNLDVLSGKQDDASGESSIDRRIKEQARARAIDDERAQRRLLEEAERATVEGRYDEAEAAYQSASAVTEKLAKLANAEDVAQSDELERTKQKSEDNAVASSRKAAFRAQSVTASPPPPLAGAVAPADEVDVPAEAPLAPTVEVAAAPAPPTVVTPELIRVVGTTPPAKTEATGPSRRPAPAVVATSASVVVPTHGEAVRYQHLLLPAGEPLALEVRARATNHRPRSPR